MLPSQLAKNKAQVNEFLRDAGLPVAVQGVAKTSDQCIELARKIGFPVVVKPATQDFARGVFVNLRTEESVRSAFDRAKQMGPVIVESYNEGREYRVTVVNNQVTSVYERVAPAIMGDGVSSVRELVQAINDDPLRVGVPNGMAPLTINQEMREVLGEQGLDFSSILAAGRSVKLLRIPMIMNGGIPFNCMDVIHPDNEQLMIRAVRLIGLDIAGVDFMAPDIARSWHAGGCAILEVNSQPLLVGDEIINKDRDYFATILDRLLGHSDGRIPVVVIGGRSVASIAAQRLSELLCRSGFRGVGVASQEGAWLDQELLGVVSASGAAARDVLFVDPMTQLAVIQCPIPEVLTEGLPCDGYDVAVLLESQQAECDERKQPCLAAVAELARGAKRFVIVNADDSLLCSAVLQADPHQLIFISEQKEAKVLNDQLPDGALALVNSAAGVELCRDGEISLFLSTRSGKLGLVKLAALGAAIALGVDTDKLRNDWGILESAG